MSSRNLCTSFRYWGFTCATVTCMVGVLLSGCAAPTPLVEPVTITFAYPDFEEGYYEALVQNFNMQYPHITVQLQPKNFGELDDVDAGGVDVFVTWPEALVGLQAEGQVLNLDPFFEQDDSFDADDFYPGAIDNLSFQNRTWAVPAGVDVLVMYYNKDLFDQHQVPYPEVDWTWNDFMNAGQAITDPEAGIYGYATTGVTTEPEYFDAALFIYQHGGRLFDSLQDPTRTVFDDPLTVEALEWYAALYHEYDIAPTPQEARKAFGGNQYAFYQGIQQGKVGMWMGGFSQRGGWGRRGEWFIKWGMVPLPRDVQPITQGDVEGYAIYAQTEHPDACWQWITFLSRQVSPDVERPQRLIPPRRSVAESKAYEQLVGGEIAAAARASMENAVLINFVVFADFEEAMGMFAGAVGEIVDQEADPQEVMTRVQQQIESSMP